MKNIHKTPKEKKDLDVYSILVNKNGSGGIFDTLFKIPYADCLLGRQLEYTGVMLAKRRWMFKLQTKTDISVYSLPFFIIYFVR